MFIRPGNGRRGRLSQVWRPMITGLPRVSALKRTRSDFSRQGRDPPADDAVGAARDGPEGQDGVSGDRRQTATGAGIAGWGL